MQPPEEETHIGTAYQESETDSHNTSARQYQDRGYNDDPNLTEIANQEPETEAHDTHGQGSTEPGANQILDNSTEEAEPEIPLYDSDTGTEDEDSFNQALSANPQEDSADDTP